MRFVDVESLLVERLPAFLPGPVDWCSTDSPEDIRGTVGVRVLLASGSDDGLTDSSLIDVESFAPTRAGAFTLAEDVRAAMAAIGATDTSAAGDRLVDRVETATRPVWRDYRATGIHRVVASYRVFSRKQ